MRAHKFILGVAAASMLLVGSHAQAGTYFDADAEYRTAEDSPFAGLGTWYLEDFEDDSFASGLSWDGGFIRTPGMYTDSVDNDDPDGIDDWGTLGTSYGTGPSPTGHSFTFSFDSGVLGGLPTYAGLVWTDGKVGATVTFQAFDASGVMVGEVVTVALGTAGHRGETPEDRFLGVSSDAGIDHIVITTSSGNLEVDHVQYAAVIPLPAPLAMGLAGLGLVALARRRRLA